MQPCLWLKAEPPSMFPKHTVLRSAQHKMRIACGRCNATASLSDAAWFTPTRVVLNKRPGLRESRYVIAFVLMLSTTSLLAVTMSQYNKAIWATDGRSKQNNSAFRTIHFRHWHSARSFCMLNKLLRPGPLDPASYDKQAQRQSQSRFALLQSAMLVAGSIIHQQNRRSRLGDSDVRKLRAWLEFLCYFPSEATQVLNIEHRSERLHSV